MERLACVQAIFFDAQERPVKEVIAQERNSRVAPLFARGNLRTVDVYYNPDGKIISIFGSKIISVFVRDLKSVPSLDDNFPSFKITTELRF